MNIKVYPSKIEGEVSAPSSKSLSHRAIIIASLAKGASIIENVLLSDDVLATIKACKRLGAKISQNKSTLKIEGTGGKINSTVRPIELGSSGSSMRILIAVAALSKNKITITGSKQLGKRPIKELLYALNKMGAKTSVSLKNNIPMIRVEGSKIKGGEIYIRGDISSQYISALLMVTPLLKGGLKIKLKNELVSKPYVSLTIDIMKKFGVNVKNNNFKSFEINTDQEYKATSYKVEGDYSSASYLFAAAAINSSSIRVKNLNINSKQGDMIILDILKKMGCVIKIKKNSIMIKGPNELKSIKIGMKNFPDLVPALSTVAAFAKGKTVIKNIDHLKYKESDRVKALINELSKIGVKISEINGNLIIEGISFAKDASIKTYDDHRMAMSMALTGLKSKNSIIINDANVVSKSYPNFWKDFKKIGAKITYEKN